MIKEITIKTSGMSCTSCERIISESLMKLEGVKEAKADYASQITKVKYEDGKTNLDKIRQAIENAGYDFNGEVKSSGEKAKEKKELFGFKF